MTVHFGLIQIKTKGQPRIDLHTLPFWVDRQIKSQIPSSEDAGTLMHMDYYDKDQTLATIQVKPAGWLKGPRAILHLDDKKMDERQPNASKIFQDALTELFNRHQQKYETRTVEGSVKDHSYFQSLF